MATPAMPGRPSLRRCATFGLEHPCGGARVFLKLGSGPGWAGKQLSAAVRACSRKALACAVAAERAFERTDSGIDRIRWQVAITAFTTRAHLEHGLNLGAFCQLSNEATRSSLPVLMMIGSPMLHGAARQSGRWIEQLPGRRRSPWNWRNDASQAGPDVAVFARGQGEHGSGADQPTT
jgi:hypothetical protein